MDINNLTIYNTNSTLEMCDAHEFNFTSSEEIVIEQPIIPIWYIFNLRFLLGLLYTLFTCNFVKMFVYSFLAITIVLIYIIIMWIICYVLVLRKIALFKSVFE